MKLICLDLEIDRPKFIEDPTFLVILDIGDLLDENLGFLDEGEEGGCCCNARPLLS